MGSPRFQYAAERPSDNYCNTLGTPEPFCTRRGALLSRECYTQSVIPAQAEMTTRPSPQFVELFLAEAVVADEAPGGGKDNVFGDVGRQVGDTLEVAADE